MNTCKKLATVAAALSVTIFAQEQPSSPKGPSAPAPRVGATGAVGPGARPMQRFDRSLQDMTPEQRTKLDEVSKNFSATATPLYARLVTARRELDGLVNQDKVDEA